MLAAKAITTKTNFSLEKPAKTQRLFGECTSFPSNWILTGGLPTSFSAYISVTLMFAAFVNIFKTSIFILKFPILESEGVT